jgi:hypothetical protein
MLYSFFSTILRRLNSMCRRFGTKLGRLEITQGKNIAYILFVTKVQFVGIIYYKYLIYMRLYTYMYILYINNTEDKVILRLWVLCRRREEPLAYGL